MIKFQLFKKEHYRQQREKHQAYIKAGFKLVGQMQEKNGIIKRQYLKGNA